MAAAEEDPVIEGEEEDEDEQDLSNSDVCTKYREAGKIANVVLTGVISQCVAGARILDICKFGDTVISQSCQGIYRTKKAGKIIEKGIAFPTCVSVNECVCHNSPLESDGDTHPPLAENDVVKIDLGVHIDGCIAVVAHTLIVGATLSVEAPLTGPVGNLMSAAHICSEVATKLIRPGNTNKQVAAACKKVADTFGVSLVAGTLSHQMKRFVIDGNKVILLREDVDQEVDDSTFELNEVYAVDIALSTGDGKPKESEQRTTVFKRAVDKSYRLKMKSSRYLLTEVNNNHATLPFTLRAFGDERQARMGVIECIKHELVHPYPVLMEQAGENVVHFKFTLLILPSGTVRITGGAPEFYEAGHFSHDKTLDEETSAVLSMSSKKKKKKSNKKKKKAADGAGAEEEGQNL